ncbi:AAA family ATPase [Pseudovibrio exalbescens]|uniref:AAA family ATPase n=1 Tax=Pseudovibrio exalbescens TaxID=197461 RepID=UPI0023670FAE|nr:AAA family ATPase [Pseudovibrio exalbescens]MDD7908536.1 AAA family ATPase [Pseudovibrio exalbescens]
MSDRIKQAWDLVEPVAEIPEKQKWAWLDARTAAKKYAENKGFSKAAFAREVGIPAATFSEWWSGKYRGDYGKTTEAVSQFVENQRAFEQTEMRIPDDLDYVETPTSQKVMSALQFAQAMPEMVVIVLGAGMGKSITVRKYQENHSHTYLATMRPTTATPGTMLNEIGLSMGIFERSVSLRERAIGERVQRNGRKPLLIIDEAQNLNDNAVNQLRHFLDIYQCGIALIGNEELYTRFGGTKPKAAYAQINRRIGMRVRQMRPSKKDIDVIVDAWGIEDEDACKMLRLIGSKPGALSQISKTVRLAHMLAMGSGGLVNAELIRAAWSNRGGEEL